MNAQIIKDFMDDNGLTNTDFCRLAGISHSTLNKMLAGGSNIRLPAVYRVAHVLGCSWEDLLDCESVK